MPGTLKQQEAVRDAMRRLKSLGMAEPFTTDVAKAADMTTKRAYSTLAALLKKGVVRRAGQNLAYWALNGD